MLDLNLSQLYEEFEEKNELDKRFFELLVLPKAREKRSRID